MNKIHEYYKNTKNALPHKNVQKVLEMHIIPGNAIDLGCGAGRDTICLIKNGWNVLAIDKEETKGLVEEKLNEFWNKIEESIEKGRIFCWELFSEQKIHG